MRADSVRRIVRTGDGWGLLHDDGIEETAHPLAELLAGAPLAPTGRPLGSPQILAPVDRQEVWGSGVTYERSLTARAEESIEPDACERVYRADRPELFLKATPERVQGPRGVGTVRSDSTWDVPEPEVGDTVHITVDPIGTLSHTVELLDCGRPGPG